MSFIAENIESIQYTSIFIVFLIFFLIKFFDLKGDRLKEYYCTSAMLGFLLCKAFIVFVISTIARFWL